MLGDIYSGKPANNATNNNAASMYNPKKFVCKNNGVLFENDLIQIGVKSEFRQNLGRLALFYGNKSSVALTNFQTNISWNEDQSAKLNIQLKPSEANIVAGAQIQQMLNVECIEDYIGTINANQILYFNML